MLSSRKLAKHLCVWQKYTDIGFLTVALLTRKRKETGKRSAFTGPKIPLSRERPAGKRKHIKMHWSKVMLLEADCAPKLCSWDYIPRRQGAWLRAILSGSKRMKASVSTAIKSMHGWLLPGWLEAAVTWVWTLCWWGTTLNGFPSDPWLQGSAEPLHKHRAEIPGHRSDASVCSQLATVTLVALYREGCQTGWWILGYHADLAGFLVLSWSSVSVPSTALLCVFSGLEVWITAWSSVRSC